jgi:hypothetical protein
MSYSKVINRAGELEEKMEKRFPQKLGFSSTTIIRNEEQPKTNYILMYITLFNS